MTIDKTEKRISDDSQEGGQDIDLNDGLLAEGSPLDLFWYLKDLSASGLADVSVSSDLPYFSEIVYRHLGYEQEALTFASTSELLTWVNEDEDRVNWAWTNPTYRRLLESSCSFGADGSVNLTRSD
jgi:hypothetical protein